MFKFLIVLFLVVPAVEVTLLAVSSQLIGAWPTFFIVIGTGVIGAYLAKQQGIAVIREIRNRFGRGQMPADSLLDGACILVGGALLLMPGYATDLLGFGLLIPFFRRPVKYIVMHWIERKIKSNTIIMR